MSGIPESVWRRALRGLCAGFAVLAIGAAGAGELAVLSAGAVEPGVNAAIASWKRDTGNVAAVTFSTAPRIAERLEGAERFDVVIAPPAVVERFAKAGVLGNERVDIGRVGLGVAVRPGAPLPDISSSEALRRSILDAESIVFNRASTGQYFEGLLKKMGIFDQVASRITRYPDGAAVMEHVLHGQGREIGFGPLTEILLQREKGLQLVGPLPAEIQNTTAYVAVLHRKSVGPELAEAFLRYLATPATRARFAAAGIE